MDPTTQYVTNLSIMMRKQAPNTYGIYQFILDRGIKFKITESSFPRLGKMKECFRNAAMLVTENKNYTYCEGFAMGAVIPVLHAWCIDGAGNVIDPTWENGSDYLGVPFNTKYLWSTITRTHCFTSLIDNWTEGFPLLKNSDEQKLAIHSCIDHWKR